MQVLQQLDEEGCARMVQILKHLPQANIIIVGQADSFVVKVLFCDPHSYFSSFAYLPPLPLTFSKKSAGATSCRHRLITAKQPDLVSYSGFCSPIMALLLGQGKA